MFRPAAGLFIRVCRISKVSLTDLAHSRALLACISGAHSPNPFRLSSCSLPPAVVVVAAAG